MDWIIRKTHASNGQPFGPDHKFMEGVKIKDRRSGAHDLIHAAAKEWGCPVTHGEVYAIEPDLQPRVFTVTIDGRTVEQ